MIYCFRIEVIVSVRCLCGIWNFPLLSILFANSFSLISSIRSSRWLKKSLIVKHWKSFEHIRLSFTLSPLAISKTTFITHTIISFEQTVNKQTKRMRYLTFYFNRAEKRICTTYISFIFADNWQQIWYIYFCSFGHLSLFSIFAGLSTLIKRLDVLNYSTVYYMFDGNNIRDSGSNCDMAHQLSTAYRKQIILWPCPQMKVRAMYRFWLIYLIAVTNIFHFRDRIESRLIDFQLPNFSCMRIKYSVL